MRDKREESFFGQTDNGKQKQIIQFDEHKIISIIIDASEPLIADD